MKKRFVIWLAIVALPFLIMVVTNSALNHPTRDLLPDKCSRYCHDKGCPHTHFAQGSVSGKVYHWHIHALKNNGAGLSYAEANILIYVCFFPILMAWLLWKAIPKSGKI